MKIASKFCQSCGMPIKDDPEIGGTNKDGSKSIKFCSYYYQKGKFTFNGNVNEMQKFCKDKMIENDIQDLLLGYLKRHSEIRALEKNSYILTHWLTHL